MRSAPCLSPGPLYVVGQFALLLGIGTAPAITARAFGGPGTALTGSVLLLAGGVLTLAGAAALGRSLSALPEPTRHAELVDTGLYGVVRHPIYGGLLLLALGWSLRHGNALSLALTVALLRLLLAKASHEERALMARFPGYPVYARRVRRFIPGVC